MAAAFVGLSSSSGCMQAWRPWRCAPGGCLSGVFVTLRPIQFGGVGGAAAGADVARWTGGYRCLGERGAGGGGVGANWAARRCGLSSARQWLCRLGAVAAMAARGRRLKRTRTSHDPRSAETRAGVERN